MMHISAFPPNNDAMMNGINYAWIEEGGQAFNLAILIIASLNVAAATLMILLILYRAWRNREWDFFFKTRHFNFISAIHLAEVFPIIFATIVIFQGAVLIPLTALQSHDALHSCKPVAQFVWPVLWIAPYTMLVFGLETTFRSLKMPIFSSQTRWHISVRFISIVSLVLLTWVPALASPIKGHCLASLIWWTAPYAKAGVAICMVLIFAYITSASVITFQLRTARVDRDQRIQASRIVYYLLISSLILIFVLPYYIELTMLRRAINSSKIAAVALNTTGLIPGLLYVLLRSNADTTIIQASDKPWWSRKRAVDMPVSDMDICVYLDSPMSSQSERSANLLGDPEKIPSEPFKKPLALEIQAQYADRPVPPQPVELKLPSKAGLTRHNNQSRVNYSIFPNIAIATTRESVSTTFSEDVQIPKPLFAPQRELDRQSSVTSATLEIGLRMSYPARALDPIEGSPVANTPDSPFRSPPPLYGSLAPIRGMMPSRPKRPKKFGGDISILPTQPNDAHAPSQALSPRSNLLSPNWIFQKDTVKRSSPRQGRRDMMKSLPPVPPGEAISTRHSRWSLKSFRPSWRREAAASKDWI